MRKYLVLGAAILLGVFFFVHFLREPFTGFDRNHDGVRDDLETYINKTAKTQRINIAMRAVAKDYQAQILDMRTPYEPTLKNVTCLIEEAASVGQDGADLIMELQARFANTKERQTAMIHYSSQFNGKVLFDPAGFDIPCPWERK